MIGGLGIGELVIILLIVLLIFGPSKLGDIGSSLGKGISGFKKAMQDKGSKEEEASEEADENNDSKGTD
ncbi:MAG: twin-arginine translocase TatA/TatE family subunit [Spirochaetales bacterium]|jgi:sec-independent protein translocase protein TatA|nr:twin-arginine translocase TatA/TatE family subunit [Spirochaetales bacterium]|tara:strand:+ start:1411 stop:1617 length:207 start_codon:yes stop_codon:yes gene_type:complete